MSKRDELQHQRSAPFPHPFSLAERFGLEPEPAPAR